MSSTRKGQTWHFGMKAHIGVDAKSGLVHHVHATTASVHDSTVTEQLLHGEERALVGDSAYGSMQLKAHCRQAGLIYLINDKPSAYTELTSAQHRANWHKSQVRAKVEFPFRIVKHLWGHTRVRYKGLLKNCARLYFLFALSNLFQVRRALLAA
jgi:transposase, IS5 family